MAKVGTSNMPAPLNKWTASASDDEVDEEEEEQSQFILRSTRKLNGMASMPEDAPASSNPEDVLRRRTSSQSPDGKLKARAVENPEEEAQIKSATS